MRSSFCAAAPCAWCSPLTLKEMEMKKPWKRKLIIFWKGWGYSILIAVVIATSFKSAMLLCNLFHFKYFGHQTIAITYFASAIIAFIGLLRLRIWGFIAAYTHILIATIFLSISVLPFLFDLLRLDYGTVTTVLLISNLTMLFLIAVLHGIKRTLNRKSLITS